MAENFNALVTGASGFLGSFIVDELLSRGDRVIALDTVSIKKVHPNLQGVVADIRDEVALAQCMENVQEVYHLAAIADIGCSRKNVVETVEVNITGTAKCLKTAHEAGVDRFIYASSVYVGGRMGSFYGVSKQAGEAICKTFNEEFGLKYTICRYGSLYGRGANEWNMIKKLCRSILTKKEYEFWGNGDEIREYINIKDASRETVRVARDPNFVNMSVLIAGHQRMKTGDLFKMIEEITGVKDIIKYKNQNDHRHYKITPYCFSPDIPARINMSHFIDISEGIVECLKEIAEESKVGY
ncbi:MAG: hypothetical protein VR68_09240 [Peptococcaceae bacterium BRH_c4a]|nr:MAG: hypothetical protein VR68_09240 [Peptococcaceae bacterium BRH_c4a]